MSVGSYSKLSSSSGMITLQVSEADMLKYSAFAREFPKAMVKAQRRAINKTLGWLRTHIARDVGRAHGIAMRAVRQRLRAYTIKGSATSGKLWFGINPIAASRTGRPRQTQKGVSVGRRRYAGAFYGRAYGKDADIWIRTASKHFDPADYPDSEISGGGGGRSGWIAENSVRFPLAKAKVSLDDVRTQFREWTQKAEARLLEILRQEINYETHKLMGGARG